MSWHKVSEILKFAIDKLFYGKITVHFQKGKITHLERVETIK